MRKIDVKVPIEGAIVSVAALEMTALGAVSTYHSDISRLGGLARTGSMTKQQRKALAKKAGNARWIKYRREKQNRVILAQIYAELVEYLRQHPIQAASPGHLLCADTKCAG